MLIQLPNGDWVAPESVTAVRIQTDLTLDFEPHTQVAVELEYGRPSWCKSDAPEALRDQIAEQVNRALYKPEGTP